MGAGGIGAPAIAAGMAASRAANCVMMRARSAAPKSIQWAISSSERPQPMQRRSVGCTTQTRVQGVSIPVSSLAMLGLGGNRGTINSKNAKARL
jgi:hypothetical protein